MFMFLRGSMFILHIVLNHTDALDFTV